MRRPREISRGRLLDPKSAGRHSKTSASALLVSSKAATSISAKPSVNTVQDIHDFQTLFVGARASRSFNPELKTFSQWTKENASRIPIPE